MTDEMDVQARIDERIPRSRWLRASTRLATPIRSPAAPAAPPQRQSRKRKKKPKARTCRNCGREGHYITTCPHIKPCCRAMINKRNIEDSNLLTIRLSCGSCAQVWTWTVPSYPVEEALSHYDDVRGLAWEREE